MKKDPRQMSDKELLDIYKLACKWTQDRMQVTDTDKDERGQTYNHKQFMNGLNRIEQLENEMQRRGLAY